MPGKKKAKKASRLTTNIETNAVLTNPTKASVWIGDDAYPVVARMWLDHKTGLLVGTGACGSGAVLAQNKSAQLQVAEFIAKGLGYTLTKAKAAKAKAE